MSWNFGSNHAPNGFEAREQINMATSHPSIISILTYNFASDWFVDLFP
jgi:hypothetical protein